MKQAKEVCKEMLLGLAFWVGFVAVALTVFSAQHLAAAVGTLAGGAVGAALILHMYRHLDIALDLDVKQAQKHIQAAAFQRLFIMGAAVALSLVLSGYIHPVGVILSLFGVKVTALLNPVLHRLLAKGRYRNSVKG